MEEAGFWATEWRLSIHPQTRIQGPARRSVVKAVGLVELK
jgi:hypothetical protein